MGPGISGRRSPVWLVVLSRYANAGRTSARIILILLTVLMVATLLPTAGPKEVSSINQADAVRPTDPLIDQTITARVRGGEGYYSATAKAMRAQAYPLKPFTLFALPTATVVKASLPDRLLKSLMWTLAALTVVAWTVRLRPVLQGNIPLVAAAILLAAGLFGVTRGQAAEEAWSGELIALSLALRQHGRWLPSVALGIAAMTISAVAVPYAVVMLAVALADGEPREATGWVAAIGIFALVMLAHAHAVRGVVEPMDRVSTAWLGMQGIGNYIRTAPAATAFGALPIWLASLVWVLALFGWTAWRHPTANRTVVLLAVYATMVCIVAHPDAPWGLISAPLPLLGLVFAPDGLRDLAAAALDRRRITVRRVIR